MAARTTNTASSATPMSAATAFHPGAAASGEVDDFSPGYGAVLKSLYDRALRKRDVYAFRGWMERGDREMPFVYSESVFMPMGPDEATIDHVLNFSVYTPRDSFDG